MFSKRGDWTRWQMPVMSEAANADSLEPDLPTSPISPAALEAIRQQARLEAWQQGLDEGRQAARSELAAAALRWDGLLQQLSQPLLALDQVVEEQLLALAIALGSQLAHRELSVHPEQVLTLVRAAVKALPANTGQISVHLHPEDARFVQRQSSSEHEQVWRLVEDAALSRGGCLVVTDAARVDERIETRLERLVMQLMHDAGLNDGDKVAAA